MDWFRPVNRTSDDSLAADGSALPSIVQKAKKRFNPERRVEAPPVYARRARDHGRHAAWTRGCKTPHGLRPTEPLFRDTALVHTESATGTLPSPLSPASRPRRRLRSWPALQSACTCRPSTSFAGCCWPVLRTDPCRLTAASRPGR